MFYVKLLFSLTFVAFVSAAVDDAELANLPPCAPCNRPRREVDDDADDDLSAWVRPFVPGATARPNVPTQAPRLPNPVAAEEDETINVPSDNTNRDTENNNGARVDVNVGGSGIQWPDFNIGLGSDDSDEEDVSTTTTTTTTTARPPSRRPRPPGPPRRPEGPRDPPGPPRRPEEPRGPREEPRGPRDEARPRPGININWPSFGSNNNDESTEEEPRRPRDEARPRPGININWPSFGSNNDDQNKDDENRIGADWNIDASYNRPNRTIRIPSISWPGVNVNINGSNVRAPESNGNWNFTLPSLDLGNIHMPSLPNITMPSISGAANATKENMRKAGRIIGHFMRAVRNASDEINDHFLRNKNLTKEQVQVKFQDLGRSMREAAKSGSPQQVLDLINDFVRENDDRENGTLTQIQNKYIKSITKQISNNLPGRVGDEFENWLNRTGGWAMGAGKVEDVVANTDVDQVANIITHWFRKFGPRGVIKRIGLTMKRLGLEDYFKSMTDLAQQLFQFYLRINPMFGLMMNVANSVGSMGLNMPSFSMGLPGMEMITGLVQIPMNIAGSITGLPSPSGSASVDYEMPSINGRLPEFRMPSLNPSMRIPNVNLPNVNVPSVNPSLQLPNVNIPSFNPSFRIPNLDLSRVRVPRVPDVNLGWGATVGGKGAGVSIGTDGIQVTRSGEPIMSSKGIIGNMLGDGMETIVKTPMDLTEAMLRPMQFIPGVNMARNVLGSVSNMMG